MMRKYRAAIKAFQMRVHGTKEQRDDQEQVQALPTVLLSRAARGITDLQLLAEWELACRGLDRNGKWVGFDKAEKIFESRDRLES